MPLAVRCTGLYKRYDNNVEAVRGLDLAIEQGECFGLLGPNGAGKTTTVEILEGLLPATAGEVEILGKRWGRDDNELRELLGISLQETRLGEKLKVKETLQLFASFYRNPGDAMAVMEEVALTEKAEAWVGKLSGGQKQRLAVACALERRYVKAIAWLLGTALIHPLMPVYGILLLALLAWNQSRPAKAELVAAAPVLGFLFERPTEAYHQAALLHWQHYVMRWPWYCWLGIIAPITVFYWFGRIARARGMANVELLCRSLWSFVLVALLGALILDIPPRFEEIARAQPLRSLHLAYVLLVLLAGGMAGRFVLKRSAARWTLLFLPLCAGMACVQFQLFPATEHIEWPGAASRNGWVETFEWVRQHTPVDAYFALDPRYMEQPGEDEQSFRAIAERSMLADVVKDSGAVTMFPRLAEKWWEQVEAHRDWNSFQAADFQRLKTRYGVDWVVLSRKPVAGLSCPYHNQNSNLAVCQVQ
jgi:ABC-type transport system involved in cytochrome c biogenesis ATPase subunit